MEPNDNQHQQLPAGAYRNLQPQAAQAIQHGQLQLQQSLASHHASFEHLAGLEDNSSGFHHDMGPQAHSENPFHSPNFDRNHGHPPMQILSNGSPHTPQHSNGGQFGVLTGNSVQHSAIGRLQQEDNMFSTPDSVDQSDQGGRGHLSESVVENPPHLEEWRQRLFAVADPITLSAEEYVHLPILVVFADLSQ